MSLASDMLKNAEGRLSPGAFLRCALILIAIQFVLALAPLFGLGMAPTIAMALASLILLFPWIMIWIKRMHDAGYTGWLFLLFMGIWLLLTLIAGTVVRRMFGTDLSALAGVQDMTLILQAAQQQSQALALPNAAASAIVAVLTVVLANILLKSDPQPNRFGEPPAQ